MGSQEPVSFGTRKELSVGSLSKMGVCFVNLKETSFKNEEKKDKTL